MSLMAAWSETSTCSPTSRSGRRSLQALCHWRDSYERQGSLVIVASCHPFGRGRHAVEFVQGDRLLDAGDPAPGTTGG